MNTAQKIAKTLTKHVETVSPGQPFRLTAAHEPGDGVWQGDLGIQIVDRVPYGYELVSRPIDADLKLVPAGGGPGSHHRLRSLDGMTMYRPKGWGQSETELRGPCIVFDAPNEIVHEPGTAHPHGTVHIDDPMTVLCRYQRNLSVEQRVVRAAD